MENQDEYIKRRIKHYKLAKWISAGVASASILTSFVTLSIGGVKSSKFVKLNEDLNSEIDDIKVSEAYIEHVNTKQDMLYNSYKRGDLSAVEFSEELDKLHSDDYIVDNASLITTDSKSNEIKNLTEEIEKTDKQKRVMGGIGIGTLIFGAGPAAIETVCAKSREEMFK